MMPFRNEPLTDFKNPDHERKMRNALEKVRGELGRTYPLWIGGKEVLASSTFYSVNPAHFQTRVGNFQQATLTHAELAIQKAQGAYLTWKRTSASERAAILLKMAELMRKKKFELVGWVILEDGKNWGEADADVAEAIDFLEYYAREIIRLTEKTPLISILDEKNELIYEPLGVGVVISPFNFPIGILTGMAFSAVVTGNAIILKPSDRTPACAFQVLSIAHEAGLPREVIQLLTDEKADIGKYLVEHPQVRFISFTGSKKVGLDIIESAAKVRPGQKWIKKVIAEMGGKDAIVVDGECNLEEAVSGVTAAAFGFQGQKCSACSRVIVDQRVYKPFVEKLVARVQKLKVGDPAEPSTDVGPLISKAALDKASTYLEIGKTEGRMLAGGKMHSEEGYFLEPTVIEDVHPEARIAQEEIFAPVLAVIRSKNFEDSLRIANNTEYGLTGSVYTQNESHIDRAKKEFYAGNLYINRKCTGAFVGVHPFGGFNMSGTDAKAGGPDYLKLLTEAKTISQKTVKAG